MKRDLTLGLLAYHGGPGVGAMGGLTTELEEMGQEPLGSDRLKIPQATPRRALREVHRSTFARGLTCRGKMLDFGCSKALDDVW